MEFVILLIVIGIIFMVAAAGSSDNQSNQSQPMNDKKIAKDVMDRIGRRDYDEVDILNDDK